MGTTPKATRVAALILFLHITISETAKSNARPVHEIINEQARIDDKIRQGSPGNLPYGNPLAGNSQQNARLHAQNQQAMFNAERIRQHRAQLQRWTKAPQQMDSYMRAYHESQESHQLALEQQQTNQGDKKTAVPATNPLIKSRNPITRAETLKRGVNVVPDVIKITKADAVKERSRNHRSHGSIDYHHQQFLEPKAYRAVYVSPGPTYDQGVTIKPNGNIGLASTKPTEESKLFTEAIPSKTRYVVPKQYNQMQNYESAKDIEALNSLLQQSPQVQMSELNALLSSGNTESKDVLETPIDLFFYLKEPTVQNIAENYNPSYAQIPPTYASAFMPTVKDHTPITEDVDDIENPNKEPKIKPIGLQTLLSPQLPETTTTKSNNYYKVEVASQVISAGFNPAVKTELKEQNEYTNYPKPLVYYVNKGAKEHGDLSEKYLHHNAQHHGVQHLAEDGTGTSAYGDDVSKDCLKKRAKRTPYSDKPLALTEKPFDANNNTPKAEPYIRGKPFTNPRKEIETFLTTPNFPIGVATDYTNEYYDEPVLSKKQLNRGKYEYDYADEEYNEYGEDIVSPDYDYGTPNFKQSSLFSMNGVRQNYAPTMSYNQNVDLTTGFTHKYRNIKRYPQFSGRYGGEYGTQFYGGYRPQPTSYGFPQFSSPMSNKQLVPLRYGVPNIPNVQNIIEPVYMLTESQLKNLIGQHTHIQHLDVFQYPPRYPKSKPKSKKRYPYRQRNTKKHIHKLHRLNIL